MLAADSCGSLLQKLFAARRQHGIPRFRQLIRAIAAIVQPPAFVALHRTADDTVGGEYQVAQLDQVVADAEICVIVLDFLDFVGEQFDAVLGALQALVGAHDADVIS